MQFLETAAEALNKVDKLAAEVIPRRARLEDEGEDALEVNPDAVDTAAAIEALAAKLGMDPTPDTDDAATVEGDASPETRARLATLLADLRAGEATAREAAARRDHALALAADEQAVRDREAFNASEALRSIERDLAAEKAAHAATRAQAEDRERALTSDASEYDDMLAAVRRQTREKLDEAVRLEARAAAAEAAEPKLRAEAEDAEARLADARARANAAAAAATDPGPDPLADADDKAAVAKAAEAAAASRVSELREALAAARADANALAAEETTRRAADARRPSRASANRLADLERRLAETAAQLEEKRARTATLAAEKAALENSLADALMERRKVRERAAGGSDGDPGVGSSASQGVGAGAGGLKRRVGAGLGAGPLDAGDADDRGVSLTGLRVRSRAASAARRVDALSVEAGKRLRRSGGWRSAVILYVLGLHGLAFVVLAYRALGSGPTP